MFKSGCLGLAALAAVATTSALAHADGPSPDHHAPSGVMVDHLHARGMGMVALRHMRTSASRLYSGESQVTGADLAEAGFSMMPTGMTMDMVMLDLMYAPTDKLTLMLMPHYMRMEMDMAPTPMVAMPGGGEHGHGGHTHHGSHSVSGIGDTLIAALYDLSLSDAYQLVGSFGISAPTGSVDKKNADGSFVHYGMQPGSGTWDLAPALTYKDRRGALSWGTQVNARIRLESANDSGYALGDRYTLTGWSAWKVAPWVSLSARLAYEQQGSISGHFNGSHNHSSPADLQANYGGEFIDAGLGANMVVRQGSLTGLRLELEWTTRLDEDYNGYQLGRDHGVNAALAFSF